MALAEKLHHTSRGLRFATAGEEGREEHYALRRERPPPPHPELFQLYEEEPGGSRPACLVAPQGPQEAVQRHTVEQLADVAPMVQVLDAPGLLGEVGVVDFFRELDAPALDELVIAVPKFYLPRIPKRCPRRRPRRAEQLVEVPTIISNSSDSSGLPSSSSTFQFLMIVVAGAVEEAFRVSLRDRVQLRFVEQNSSTFQFLQVVVDGSVMEAFKVSPRDRIQQRTWSRTLTFQLVVVFTVFFQARVLPHRAACLTMPMMEFKGVFALFPVRKKVRRWVRTRGRN